MKRVHDIVTELIIVLKIIVSNSTYKFVESDTKRKREREIKISREREIGPPSLSLVCLTIISRCRRCRCLDGLSRDVFGKGNYVVSVHERTPPRRTPGVNPITEI